MTSRNKPTKSLAFDEVFVQIRPYILFVKDLDVAEDLYQLAHSRFPMADSDTEPAPGAFDMTTADIIAFGMFDGGLALVENPWGDDSSVEDAFGRWVESKEAAGEDWDESNFEFESIVDYENPPLASGCFIIGREAIRYCLHFAPYQWVGLPDDLAADPPEVAAMTLNPDRQSDVRDRANLIRNEIMKCSWDHLISELNDIHGSTES